MKRIMLNRILGIAIGFEMIAKCKIDMIQIWIEIKPGLLNSGFENKIAGWEIIDHTLDQKNAKQGKRATGEKYNS